MDFTRDIPQPAGDRSFLGANDKRRFGTPYAAAATAADSDATALPAAQLEAALDVLPDGIALSDEGGKILWVNQAFSLRFGHSAHALRGQPLSIVAGPYAGQLEGAKVLTLAREGNGALEVNAFSREGMSFPCQVSVRTLEPGLAASVRVASFTDLGERRKLEAELLLKAESALREREILRSTAEALEQGLIVVDDTERVVTLNKAAQVLFGIAPGGAHGRSLTELPLPPAVRGAWLAFLSSPQSLSMQTARVTIDGKSRHLLLRVLRARNAHGTPLASVLLVRDLTRETDPDRRRNDFMTQVSHELRTPLASIQGFAETLLAEPDLPRDLRVEFLQIVQGESHRLSSLVEHLLEVAQFDSGRAVLERRVCNLVEVVREAVDHVRQGLPEAASIEHDLPSDPLPVYVDAPQVERLVTQLLANAAQHGRSERGTRVSLRGLPGIVRLTVRDWGPGIPPEALERIFDPFFRVVPEGQDPSAGGTGLGLALCRQLVERHGGTIWAEIPPDGGLKCVVELPNDSTGSA